MKQILFVILILFGLSSLSYADESESSKSKSACGDKLDELVINEKDPRLPQLLEHVSTKTTKGSRSNLKSEKEVAFRTAEFIQKKKKFPNIIDLQEILGKAYSKDLSNLKSDDRKAIRNELIEKAISEFPEAKVALLDHIGKQVIKQFKETLNIPSLHEIATSVGTNGKHIIEYLYGDNITRGEGFEQLLADIMDQFEKEINDIRNSLINKYAVHARKTRRTLSLEEFYEGIVQSKPSWRDTFTIAHLARMLNVDYEEPLTGPYLKLFESDQEVYLKARERHPRNFDKVLDKFAVNPESQEKIVELLKKHDRVLVVGAAPNVEVHEEFYTGILKFAEQKDAFVVVYAELGQPMNLEPALVNHPRVHVIHDHIELSPWEKFNTIPVHFKRIDSNSPLRQPGQGGPRGQIQIVGHPQLRDEIIATNDNTYAPHRLITSGAITKPWYSSEFPIGGVTDEQARDSHFVAALLIEKDGMNSGIDGLGTPSTFYYRQIEWSYYSHSFIDDGVRYSLRDETKILDYKMTPKEDFEATKNEFGVTNEDRTAAHDELIQSMSKRKLKATKVRSEYGIPGDKHIGGDDVWAYSEFERKMILTQRPKRYILHDLFDGKSINHWEAQDPILMARKALNGELNLQAELDKVVAYMNYLLQLDPEMKLIVVEANHNNWLTRCLKEMDKLSEHQNSPLVHELMSVVMNTGADPLEYYVKSRMGVIQADPARRVLEKRVNGIIDESRIQFLPKGASLKAGPVEFSVEVGEHGHNSPGLSRAGITLRTTAGRSYTGIAYGHTHSSGRTGRAANAGASIHPEQDYAMGGASSTSMGYISVHDDGTFQVYNFNIHSLNYRLGDDEPLPEEEFFYAHGDTSWPRILEHEEKELGIKTADQFRRVTDSERNNSAAPGLGK